MKKQSILNKRYRAKYPDKYAFSALKNNAKRRGKKFTITFDQFKEVWQAGKTIDRIDAARGYEPGNIQSLTLLENSYKSINERPIRTVLNDEAEQFINDCPF